MLCMKLPCVKTDSRAFWLRVLQASGCIGDGGSSSCSTSLPARMARGKKAHPARRGELPLLCQDFASTRVGATQLCPPLPMAGLLLHMPLCVLPELCRALCFQAQVCPSHWRRAGCCGRAGGGACRGAVRTSPPQTAEGHQAKACQPRGGPKPPSAERAAVWTGSRSSCSFRQANWALQKRTLVPGSDGTGRDSN